MFRRQSDGGIDRASETLRCLAGKADDKVDVDVADVFRPGQAHGLFGLGG